MNSHHIFISYILMYVLYIIIVNRKYINTSYLGYTNVYSNPIIRKETRYEKESY